MQAALTEARAALAASDEEVAHLRAAKLTLTEELQVLKSKVVSVSLWNILYVSCI